MMAALYSFVAASVSSIGLSLVYFFIKPVTRSFTRLIRTSAKTIKKILKYIRNETLFHITISFVGWGWFGLRNHHRKLQKWKRQFGTWIGRFLGCISLTHMPRDIDNMLKRLPVYLDYHQMVLIDILFVIKNKCLLYQIHHVLMS